VTGYIGYQTLNHALKRGYRVRAVVRRQSSIEELKRNPIIADRLTQEKLDFVVISDFLKQDVFLEFLDGVTAIVHIASPLAILVSDRSFFTIRHCILMPL
jgi:uncharacterized protein YbjT (DUF2867 family)